MRIKLLTLIANKENRYNGFVDMHRRMNVCSKDKTGYVRDHIYNNSIDDIENTPDEASGTSPSLQKSERCFERWGADLPTLLVDANNRRLTY
jgi:hypothetical protein